MNLNIDVTVEFDPWRILVPDPEAICQEAVSHLLALDDIRPFFEGQDVVELSILLTDDDKIRELNAYHRGHDYPTDVLSFPQDVVSQAKTLTACRPILLGDIVLAYGVVCNDAERHNIFLERHVVHLVIHGLLHLLGYDHLTEEDAQHMEALEHCALDDIYSDKSGRGNVT